MSDPHATPHPMDKAYVEAEATLADEAARAARRARVLAAVGREAPSGEPAGASRTGRRGDQRPLGWLAAASVAGLAVLIASRSDLAPPRPPVPPPAPAPALPSVQPSPPRTTGRPEAAPGSMAAARPASPAASREQKPEPVSPPAAAPPRPEGALRADAAPQPAPPPLPLPPVEHRIEEPRPPAARTAAPAASTSIQELVVTQDRRPLTGPPPVRLRAAAAAGRTDDVEALLASGVPVDAADAEGETPLMKAVQAEQAAAAALLRRRGASLIRKNNAGVSAQDMAVSIANPELNRALGLKP
ncbi:MAG: ankyrin repeat domain-containing protein [Phenylobacterium sp.]